MNTKDLTLLQKAGVFALVCAGVLALSGVWYIFQNNDRETARTFTVQGVGEVDVLATKATINADFVGEGDSAEVAIKNLTDMSKTAFAELEKAGVTKDKIKTANVSTNPKYEYCYNYGASSYPTWCKGNPSQNRIVGYEAMQNFTVSIDNDQALVEKLLGLFPSLGARNMNGPNWTVDNEIATQQAREEAVQKARAKAEGIAKSLGMRLGDVQFYSENNGGGYPVPMMYSTKAIGMGSAAMDAVAPSVPVSQGTDKVTVTVDITYELD